MQLIRGINMAGLNTKTGQRNAPSPYSANASKAPVPKQVPGGGTDLENKRKEGFIELKPKPGTSAISATLPKGKFDDLDQMRAKEKQDADYYAKLVDEIQQKNRGFSSQESYLTSERSKQAAEKQTTGQMDMAKFQADQTAKGNFSAAINQVRTANIDRDAANAQNQALADRQRQEIGYKSGKDLQDYYADVQKNQLGFLSNTVNSRAAQNQNYQYWG